MDENTYEKSMIYWINIHLAMDKNTYQNYIHLDPPNSQAFIARRRFVREPASPVRPPFLLRCIRIYYPSFLAFITAMGLYNVHDGATNIAAVLDTGKLGELLLNLYHHVSLLFGEATSAIIIEA